MFEFSFIYTFYYIENYNYERGVLFNKQKKKKKFEKKNKY